MKKTLITLSLVVVLLFGTACGGRPKYNSQSDLPEGADALELARVGHDFLGGNHYVEVVAGEMVGDAFSPLGGELIFKLDNDEFTATFWDPHGTGLTEKETFTTPKEFYEGYYRETLKYVPEFYPVASYYRFGQDDKLIYLDEVRDTIYSPDLDAEDE